MVARSSEPPARSIASAGDWGGRVCTSGGGGGGTGALCAQITLPHTHVPIDATASHTNRFSIGIPSIGLTAQSQLEVGTVATGSARFIVAVCGPVTST